MLGISLHAPVSGICGNALQVQSVHHKTRASACDLLRFVATLLLGSCDAAVLSLQRRASACAAFLEVACQAATRKALYEVGVQVACGTHVLTT